MAVIDENPLPVSFDPLPAETADEYIQRTASEFKKLLDVSDNLKSGEIVGAVLQFQRTDGFAFYRVSKEAPLTLQHVPYGDSWHAEAALVRGLRRRDVEDQLQRARSMKALFSRKN